MNKVQGTVMQGWKWCTLCSSGSHLDSLLLSPRKTSHQSNVTVSESDKCNLIFGETTPVRMSANTHLHKGKYCILKTGLQTMCRVSSCTVGRSLGLISTGCDL